MIYPQNMKHIRNKLQCDYNACTSKTSRKERYWKIESMHVGVKLLDQHEWTSDSHPWLWMTVGRSVSTKSAKMTRRSKWTPCWEKFFEKYFRAFSSRNRIWEGVGSEEDEAPERRGFWDGVDLRLGAINTTNVNKREREGRKRQSEKSQRNSNITSILKIEYVRMGNAWTCDMQKKLHHRLSPIQSYQHTSSSICITHN